MGELLLTQTIQLPLQRGLQPVEPSQYPVKSMKTDQLTGDKLLQMKKANLIDTRSQAEYLGIYLAAEDERPGTLPGAQSLPYDWFTVNGSGNYSF